MKNFIKKYWSLFAIIVVVLTATGITLAHTNTINEENKNSVIAMDNSTVYLEDAEDPEIVEEFHEVDESVIQPEKKVVTKNIKYITVLDEEVVGPQKNKLPEGYALKVNKDGKTVIVEKVKTQEPKTEKPKTEKPKTEDPKEPVEEPVEERQFVTCNISCHGILDCATDGLKAAIPSEGYLLTSCQVEIAEGDSVYDVLERVVSDKGVSMTAGQSTYGMYVSMIDGLNDSKVGHTAGWCYYVNGVMPTVSSDATILSDGDSISWEYDDDWALDF